jgi:hypothetical protein
MSKRSGPLPFQKRMSIARSGRLLKASTATLDRIEADADARAKRMALWIDDAAAFAAKELERAQAELLARQAMLETQQSIADLARTGMNALTVLHTSDCAVHNEPAMPAGPCDCGAQASADGRRLRGMAQAALMDLRRSRNRLRHAKDIALRWWSGSDR